MRAGMEQAYGQRCTRCRQLMNPGQLLEPDHLDGGGPTDYAGWAHASCNHSAGASRGNALRAAAYRALKGAIVGQAVAANGTAPAAPAAPAEPRRCQRTREEITAEAQTTGKGLPCVCGGHSRCW
jgi:hypothetical protein